MVEADGEWHTTDNKYASMRWKVSHSPSATAGSSSPRKIQPSVKSRSESPTKSDDSKARPGEEIVILDSDDEDEGRVKRELSPSFASASSGNRSHSNFLPIQPSAGDIIDLTLDSDDEGSPTQPTFSSSSGPSSSRIIEKRKAPELDLPPLAPKKSRADDNDTIMRVMAMRTLTVPANGNTSGAGREHASAFRQRSSNPLPPPRYAHNASASAPSRFPARYEGSSAYHNHHPFRESPSATRGPANSAPSPGSSYSTWSPWSQ
jgi:E3 SUMO-protein ligase PIAS1